ncbi:MAG: hypothetical protein Tsb002_17770 [Wenzhouxiangellaceae bacterium]
MKKLLAFISLIAFTGMAAAQQVDFSQLLATAPQPSGSLNDCTNVDDLINQPLGMFGTAVTADEELLFETREAVTSAGSITTLPAGTAGTARVWGLSLEFNNGFVGPCSEDDTTGFNVSIYADNAGAPGALIDTTTATAVVTDTGTPFALGANILEIDLTFASPLTTDGGSWVGIQRMQGNDTGGGNSCVFLQVNETDAALFDNVSFQNDDGLDVARTDDLTLCMAAGGTALPPPAEVPTLNTWTAIALALGLLLIGGLVVRRRAA